MTETELRVMDALSRELGNTISINEITARVHRLHGSAYYANIYWALRNLAAHGLVTQTRAGKASLVSLNFRNYLLIDMLVPIELKRKLEFLRNRTELQLALSKIEEYCRGQPTIRAACLTNPERNASLNRIELLMLLQSTDWNGRLHSLTRNMLATMRKLQGMHNFRIDFLALSTEEFSELLATEETNPIKVMMTNKIAFYAPQAFWMEIGATIEKGIKIRTEKEIDLVKLPEIDLGYNLARFGYTEFGREIKPGRELCIEETVASVLLKGDARRMEAIPIILAKNRPNYRLLIFLTQKYGTSGKLLALLHVMNKIKPFSQVEEAIEILRDMGAREGKVDEKAIAQKMKLYHAG